MKLKARNLELTGDLCCACMASCVTVAPLAGGACSYVASAPRQPRTRALVLAVAVAALALIVTRCHDIGLPTAAALVTLLCGLYVAGLRFAVRDESLTAIEGVGLQLSTRSASGRETTRFIEATTISAIFIAEAVHFDRCYFYLACLLHGEEGDDGLAPRMVVPFSHILPPLPDLQRVCLGVCAVLWRGSPPGAVGVEPMGGGTRQ